MSKQWYLMNRPLFNSGYEKEEFENYAEDGFAEALNSFIGTEIYVYPTLDSKIQTKGIIQNVTTDSGYNTFIRQILTPIGGLLNQGTMLNTMMHIGS